jgi:hypothetical protein
MSTRDYLKYGFEHLRRIIDEDSVLRFRSLIVKYADEGNEFPLDPAFCLSEKEILKMAFNPQIVSALKQKFHPNYVMFPDIEVQYNLIGGYRNNEGKFDGWHMDCGSEGHKRYLLEKGYGFAKVGIYFQDNSDFYGGGIDLAPASHVFLGLGSLELSFFLKKVLDKFRIMTKAKKVNTIAGDVLFFDSRLQHRSSRVALNVGKEGGQKFQSSDFVSLPKGKEKIVVYYDIAYPNSCIDFWDNAKRRAQSENLTEVRHFRGYTNKNANLSLFKDFARSNGVSTILDYVGG